jgi:formylglycine-generating enzyme required for sulfatase activity
MPSRRQASADPKGKEDEGATSGRPTKVGSNGPSKLSLYAMQGNVFQWCEHGTAKEEKKRVTRGGC